MNTFPTQPYNDFHGMNNPRTADGRSAGDSRDAATPLACHLPPAGFPKHLVHEVLSHPEVVLPILAWKLQEDVVLYSKEINGRFVFVSGACEAVLGYSRGELVNRAMSEFLSDSSSNTEYIASCWKSAEKPEPAKRQCEIRGRAGDRIQVEQWDVPVVHEGKMVGVTGILWRKDHFSRTTQLSPEDQILLEASSKLTAVEREVIELVVDGFMNKKIAAQLEVALRTIESRRARAMAKLNVVSLSQLVKCWMKVRRLEGR